MEKSRGISFAYQEKLGIEDAIDKIKEHYKNGNTFVFESDLMNFFTYVNKNNLLYDIKTSLSDNTIDSLLEDALNQKIANIEDISEDKRYYFDGIEKGIPQGNPLSPLFSNLYLSPFDLEIKELGYNMVRYADDFVILCKNEEEARKAYTDCIEILKKPEINLCIHPLKEKNDKGKIKTNIIDLRKESITFLSITYDGKNTYPSKENVRDFKSKFTSFCQDKKNCTVSELLTRAANKLDGWVSAFYYTDDIERYAEEIDYHINRQLFLGLRKLNWNFTRKSIGKLPNKYRRKGVSSDCLSVKQRKTSGIKFCSELIKDKKSKREKK